jgi:hypothetical protein
MVDPLPREDRETGARRLRIGFVALVGGSAGLIAVQGGAGPVGIAVVALAGALIGLVLVALLFP